MRHGMVGQAPGLYREANDTWGVYEAHMNSIRATLIAELGLADTDFVRIPAFFAFPGAGTPGPQHDEAFSLLPNVANLLVVNGRLVAPDPFYDSFKSEFVSRLSAIGYSEGTSVRFIDDWQVYHRYVGEVHCGTQVRRSPSRIDWWIQEVD